jgi:tetratricopeptide (TPR) repeat protein
MAEVSCGQPCRIVQGRAPCGQPAGGEPSRRVTEQEALRALHGEDAEQVATAEAALWEMWCRSGRADLDNELRLGIAQTERQDFAAAVATFSRIIEAMPGFAEGWNKRATVRYLMRDYTGAIADCVETLARNPVHFGALSGQGLCHMALGQPAAASRCFRRALEVHPQLTNARQNLATAIAHVARGNGQP